MIIETLLNIPVDAKVSYEAIKIIQEVEKVRLESSSLSDFYVRNIPSYIDGGVDCYCFEVNDKYVLKNYSEEGYSRTVNTYKDAVQLGFDNALAKTPLMFTSDEGAVYILQEKVDTVYKVGESFVDKHLLNELIDKIRRICLFYKPYDLHRGNVGFNEDAELVILDWGHFLPTFEAGIVEPASQVEEEIRGVIRTNKWMEETLQKTY